MRSSRVVLAALFLAAPAWVLIRHSGVRAAQIAGGSRATAKARCCAAIAVGLRELDFPYYNLRDGFGSELNLVSDSPRPIDLTIAIYSERGNSVLTSATIQPSAKLPFDLRKLLASLGADVNGEFGEGSIGVYFEGTIMPGLVLVTTTNPALGLVLVS